MISELSNGSILTKKQVKNYGPKAINYDGEKALIVANVRWDDECGNGHNSFAITGTITAIDRRKYRHDNGVIAGGCLHDEIAKSFPELAPFIKWHLCSSDGPMHYVANTVYHASDRDYNGLAKGEKRQLRNGRTKLPVWQRVIRNAEGDEVSIGHHDWRDSEDAPQETLVATWEPVWTIGEGKARELDAARRSAVWPEATDEELTTPGLKERLEARLPGLMADMRRDIESLGFIW